MFKHDVLDKIEESGGKYYFVGGSCRDFLLGIKPKDIDIEVYGVPYNKLLCLLSEFGSVDEFGKSFGIIKFKTPSQEIEFALPRKDSKVGNKHTDYEVVYDINLPLEIAASRRDYTINSLMMDSSGKIYDFFNGQEDLKNKVLRATSQAFGQDALRVLRGFSLAGRFDLKVEFGTAKMCSDLRSEYDSLSLDRIWMEFFKWATMSNKPSSGLQFLIDSRWSEFYPEFHSNIGVMQNPIFHPEIFVEKHTMYVCDEAMEIANRENLDEHNKLILMFSALCHDFAKATHSQGIYPQITSYGHEEAGRPLAESFLQRIGAPKYLFDHVPILVSNHMAYLNAQSEKAVRKLSKRLEPSNIYMLSLLINSDHSGRHPLPKGLPEKAVKMLEMSKREGIHHAPPKRILEGKHLKEIGLTPSPIFGTLISQCYGLQLNGQVKNLEEALQWVKEFINDAR